MSQSGSLTQLVECLLCKQDVGSSILPGSTSTAPQKRGRFWFPGAVDGHRDHAVRTRGRCACTARPQAARCGVGAGPGTPLFARGLRCCETARWGVQMLQTSHWGNGASTGSCFRVWCHHESQPGDVSTGQGESPNGESSDGGALRRLDRFDGWTASTVRTTEGRETPKSVLWPAGCHRIRQRPTVEV